MPITPSDEWTDSERIDPVEEEEQPTRPPDIFLFVYGTLMKPRELGSFGSLYERNCYSKGEAKIKGFKMFDMGPYPIIVETGKARDVVYGEQHVHENRELFRACDLLTFLDHYEGYLPNDTARSLYIRKEINLYLKSDTSWRLGDFPAWVYVWNGPVPRKLKPIKKWRLDNA